MGLKVAFSNCIVEQTVPDQPMKALDFRTIANILRIDTQCSNICSRLKVLHRLGVNSFGFAAER